MIGSFVCHIISGISQIYMCKPVFCDKTCYNPLILDLFSDFIDKLAF